MDQLRADHEKALSEIQSLKALLKQAQEKIDTYDSIIANSVRGSGSKVDGV